MSDDMSIYGDFEPILEKVKNIIEERMNVYQNKVFQETGEKAFEHLLARIKTDDSMREKCERRGLPETAESALSVLTDAVGVRIICSFVDDIFNIVEYIRSFDDCEIIEEKDYVRHAKPNGYRSYHMILGVHLNEPDVLGRNPGVYFVELQIRTIAMDTWAALEHRMKYKKDIPNQQLLVAELKRVADELASCDLSMQTIRELIKD